MLVERVTSIPIGMKTPPEAGVLSAHYNQSRPVPRQGMLIVGHGSHCKISAAQMFAIGDHVAAAFPDVLVEVGFLEMTSPPANQVLDAMVEAGCIRIVVVPLMLLAATHSKSDVPAIIVEGRLRHPQMELIFASSLGVVPELIEIAADNVGQAGGDGLPLLVIARGTSDPDANGDAVKASRLLGEWLHTGEVSTGFTGMTWPLTPEALRTMGHLLTAKQQVAGSTKPLRMVLFFWFICNGKLIERARREIAEFTASTGIEVIDAGYFGPDPRLVDIIARRYSEALEGKPAVNCDTCAYRAPFPGQLDKVGKPIGEGHSHFAAEHRAGHPHGDDNTHDHSHH